MHKDYENSVLFLTQFPEPLDPNPNKKWFIDLGKRGKIKIKTKYNIKKLKILIFLSSIKEVSQLPICYKCRKTNIDVNGDVPGNLDLDKSCNPAYC